MSRCFLKNQYGFAILSLIFLPAVSFAQDSVQVTENVINIGEGNGEPLHSIVIGRKNEVQHDASYDNQSDFFTTTVIGEGNSAHGSAPSVLGYKNKAESDFSSTFGYANVNNGRYAIVAGSLNENESKNSQVIGLSNVNKGNNSFVIGSRNFNDAYAGCVIGSQNNRFYESIVKLENNDDEKGNNDEASKKPLAPPAAWTLVAGHSNNVLSNHSLALGRANTVLSYASGAIGAGSSAAGSRGFALGYKASVGEPVDWELIKDKEEIRTMIENAENYSDSIAIGLSSKALDKDAVSLGSFSVAVARSGFVGYDPLSANDDHASAILDNQEVKKAKDEYEKKLSHFKMVLIQSSMAMDGLQKKPFKNNEELEAAIRKHNELKGKIKAAGEDLDKSIEEMQKTGLHVWQGQLGVVAVGNDAQTRQITGVAAGTLDTDVVNVAQLKNAVQKGDQQYRALDAKIDHTESRMRKFSNANAASALATANIPQVYAPGKNAVGVGLGNMNGQSAVAVGISTINEKGDWIFKGTATVNSEGQGFGGGASYVW